MPLPGISPRSGDHPEGVEPQPNGVQGLAEVGFDSWGWWRGGVLLLPR